MSPERLEAVARTGLGPRPDEILDRYAALSARVLQTPAALIGLVGAEHDIVPGLIGLGDALDVSRQVAPDQSPTRLVAETGQAIVVNDTADEAEPAMDADVHAYAAVPLRDADGATLGALAVVDRRTRVWTAQDVGTLQALAAAVSSELRLRRTVHDMTTARLTSEAGRMLAESAESRAVDAQRDADHAREQAERSAAQLALLADVGEALSATLNAEEAASRLARFLTATLADWCLVMLTDDRGEPHDVGWAHRQPDRQADVAEFARRHVVGDGSVMGRVLRTGEGEILERIDPALVVQALPDPAARAAFARLDATSSIVLPLQARGTVFGAVALYRCGPPRPASAEHIEACTEVVRRASLAIDNARLYSRQRRVAETLQRSLLTDPPTPPRAEVVARYRAATVDAQVGGDWYDAFLLPDRSAVLVVGDVAGHDLDAAAAMGQVRSLVRGIAYDRGESPAEVLTRVDRAVTGLGLGTLATVVIAWLAPPTAGLDGHAGRTLRWSSAGHPLPLVSAADGSSVVVDGSADILLGVRPDAARRNHDVVLPSGGVLLLYTDGLIERRDGDPDEGLRRLRATLGELAGLPLDGLCDGLLHRMLPHDHEDDAALVAVRNVS